MAVVPVGNHVVVRTLEPERKTSGGIVLPESSNGGPRIGRVLSVGDGALLPNGRRTQMQVGEGDRVLLSSYAGSEVTINGEKYLVVDEDSILAILH